MKALTHKGFKQKCFTYFPSFEKRPCCFTNDVFLRTVVRGQERRRRNGQLIRQPALNKGNQPLTPPLVYTPSTHPPALRGPESFTTPNLRGYLFAVSLSTPSTGCLSIFSRCLPQIWFRNKRDATNIWANFINRKVATLQLIIYSLCNNVYKMLSIIKNNIQMVIYVFLV